MSSEDQAAIRQAISNARSMEEVERLQHMLRTGNIPGRSQPTKRREYGLGILVLALQNVLYIIVQIQVLFNRFSLNTLFIYLFLWEITNNPKNR